MSQQNAIIIFAISNQIDRSNHNDPFAALPWDDLDALYTAFFSDTLRVAIQLFDADILVYRNTKELSDDFFLSYKYRVKLFELNQTSFAEQFQSAVDTAFQSGYQRVVAVLENNPLISHKLLKLSISQLGYDDDCIVFGPTDSGSCYLVGMKSNHSSILKTFQTELTPQTDGLIQSIMKQDSIVFPLQTLNSLDNGKGLLQLRKDLEVAKLNGDTPTKTITVFKMLEKKYRFRKLFQ
ncbi:MAG: hypothetical protein HY964_02550 [Ignavibacteriales bacterium]|nr:hypothetical protein [Ignavibacteriales bacterium]